MNRFGVLATRPLRGRPLVVLVAILAMVSPLLTVTSATSATAALASKVSFTIAPSVAAPAETVKLSGVVSPAAAGRTVWLQQLGSRWSTVTTAKTNATGRYSALVRTGVVGSRTSWRAVARPTGNAAQAISVTRALAVVRARVSLYAPTSAETRLAFNLAGYGYPVRPGRTVVVQRRSGTTWIEVGRAKQSSTGRYSVRTSISRAGKFTYRAVALSWHRAAAVGSPSRVVTARAPYLLLTHSTAIAAETVKVTGKLPGVSSRAVWVQRKSGTSWFALAKTRTTSTGSYATTFKAPRNGTYAVRALAPKATVAGRVRAQYVSRAKTLRVVSQTASLSIPTSLVAARTGTATVRFAPARAGRRVTLQVRSLGRWTNVIAGKQSSTGTASLRLTAGTPATYSYRVWTSALSGVPGFATPTRRMTVTRPAPGSISGTLTDAAGTHHGLANIEVDAFSLSDFAGGADSSHRATTAANGTYTVSGLPPATDYMVCFHTPGATGGSSDTLGYVDECYNNQSMLGEPTRVTVTSGRTRTGVNATFAAGGAVSGKVTDAAGTALAQVEVGAFSFPSGAFGMATTAADGTYKVTGLPTGTDYQVCFRAPAARGGSSDAFGYVEECYDNLTVVGTPVSVTVGAMTTGIDAALAGGGAISGTVTDAGGTHHGLANVDVSVMSQTTNTFGFATTAADGTYSVKGLPTATDYQVCFLPMDAKGGSSDTPGYVDECYNNVSIFGTATPVPVTVGALRAGVNAALAGIRTP